MSTPAPEDAFEIEVGDDVIQCRDPETCEPMTRRVYFLAARRKGSTRYWPDFVHAHSFDWREGAEELLSRVRARWGDAPGEARFVGNPRWVPNTRPDPMAELAPFGAAWEAEQMERAGYA